MLIASSLLIAAALIAGPWLTLYAIVLIVDVGAALTIANVADAVVSMRQAILAVWIGLALFCAGSVGVARILL